MGRFRIAGAALGLWLAAGAAALGDDGALPGATSLGWDVEGQQLNVSIAPFYGWIPGFNGKVQAFGAPADINVSPWEVIANLDSFISSLNSAYIGTGEVTYGDAGLFYDVFFVDYLDGATLEGRLFNLRVDVAFQQLLAKVAGTYRLGESDLGHVDAMAGVSLQRIDLVVGLALNENFADDQREAAFWADPLLGLKGRMVLSENWSFRGWGMVGGFGVSSDILADSFATFNYSVNDRFDAWLGYRAAYTDFSRGGFRWNVLSHGPLIGFHVNF